MERKVNQMSEQEINVKEQVTESVALYKEERGPLIAILQQIQERLGYLPKEAIYEMARLLEMPASEIFGVLSFYAQFRTTPRGRNIVTVCRGTACHVRGAPRILKEVENRLGIKEGETTPDLEYTLETLACIGACALAPNIVINSDTHGQMTIKKLAELFPEKGEKG